MIKRSLTALTVCFLSLSALAQTSFTIKGKLGNLHDAKVYIGYSYDGKSVFDSAYLNHGTFEMTHETPYPVVALLSVSKDGDTKKYFDGENIARIYVEPGAIIWITSDENISNFESSGSKSQDDYLIYQKYMAGIEKKLDALTLEATQGTAKKDSTNRRLYMERFRTTMEERRELMKDFVAQYREMYISLDVLEEYAGHFIDYQEIEPMFSQLSVTAQKSAKGKAFLKRINESKQTAIGTQAPDFTQKDSEGSKVSLSSFKGKNVLLIFWASWSAPSRAENLEIKEMLKQFKGKNLTVIGVGLEDRKDSWIEAIQQDGLGWLQLSDLKYMKNEVAELYDVRAVPQNVLIDASGHIVARNLKGNNLKDKLTSIVAQ
ncbi:Peroxiredoxin [Chitinophaga sp. CF118]|uniref:TlpA disulfide reductase family protein n=1 Tax=Chitinophaga sp. CF118 TaxID=1884367 RepID=UPI0008E3E5CB|nr:TlpA disulfide reductase family protein [Chitinophaga sp. CF118]SFD75335.1 Peroxiredoxin [Chitinophaga sp. CF118]